MAVRTKRARMLYKLMYLLGPDNEEYLISDHRTPYSFTKAVRQTLAIYGYKYWESGNKYKEAEEQLLKDYANLLGQISDDNI